MSDSPIQFYCMGHHNLLGTHKNTFEFSRDDHLTVNGDCILGVSATFTLPLLQPALSWKRAKIVLFCQGISDFVEFDVNAEFCSNHELVIRKSSFLSDRTFGINTTKGAIDISRELIERLKNPDASLLVTIEKIF